MVQKCSYLAVAEIFFIEPTTLHFIKEIGKKIKLAPTSVRKHINTLLNLGLIKKKKAMPFDGSIANRDNEDFIFYKRVYNLYSLKEIAQFLIKTLYPKLLVVYGSYSLGEDVETGDIDLVAISESKKEPNIEKFEQKLKRNIHLIIIKKLNELNEDVRKKVLNGITLYGEI